MSDTIGRTFIFDKDLWALLDEDAKRCLRSSTKQMEAILKTYFGVADVDLSRTGVEMLGELAPRSSGKGIKVLPGAAAIESKKRKAG